MPGGETVRLCTAVTIDAEAGEISVDLGGSSSQSPTGINVILNYTQAYSIFAICSCLNPDLANNTGSLAPVRVSAPEGSIVKCKYPAPAPK